MRITRHDTKRSVKQAWADLQSKRNVSYVTLGHKKVDGEVTDIPAAIIHVTKKETVRGSNFIPKSLPVRNKAGRVIGEIATDVVESPGTPMLFGFRSGLEIVGAVPGICSMVFAHGGSHYFLTNAHVVQDFRQNQYRNVWVRNPANGQNYWTGDFVDATPIRPDMLIVNDVAILALRPGILPDDYMIDGEPQPFRLSSRPVQGDRATYWFVAAQRKVPCGDVEQSISPLRVQLTNGPTFTYDKFYHLKVRQLGQAQPGISGALLCRTWQGVNYAVGIVFGGNTKAQEIFVFPMDRVMAWVNEKMNAVAQAA